MFYAALIEARKANFPETGLQVLSIVNQLKNPHVRVTKERADLNHLIDLAENQNLKKVLNILTQVRESQKRYE